MEIFDDKLNNLIWVNYFDKTSKDTTGIFGFLKNKFSKNKYGDILSQEDAIEKLSGWTSDDISKFILPNQKSKPLGEHIYSKYFSENREKLPEHNGKEFTLQVGYDKFDLKSPIGIALVSYDNFTKKNYLEYIVVNPQITKRGNGARLLNSLTQNPSIYSKDHANKNLYAFIRNDNFISIGMFEKNGFSPIETNYIDGMTDDIWDSPYTAYANYKILDKNYNDFGLNK